MAFAIRSNSSDRELVFRNFANDYFHVTLRGLEVSATTRVYACTDAPRLNGLFQELGQLGQPWAGKKTWESLEDEFCLAITRDRLGHVCFEIEIRIAQGGPEEARVSAHLTADLGAMSSIAKDAHGFFGEK